MTVDPVGLGPAFLSLTHSLPRSNRRGIAVRAPLIAFSILTFFMLAERHVLDWLGIALPAFRIAGVLLLFWIAFEMVFELRADHKQHTADVAIGTDHIRNVAAFPLAIPLMAGPGAITAVILLSAHAEGRPLAVAALLGLLAAVMAACVVVFVAAERISDLLGVTGHLVLTHLLGMILAAMAVQFVSDGLSALTSP